MREADVVVFRRRSMLRPGSRPMQWTVERVRDDGRVDLWRQGLIVQRTTSRHEPTQFTRRAVDPARLRVIHRKEAGHDRSSDTRGARGVPAGV